MHYKTILPFGLIPLTFSVILSTQATTLSNQMPQQSPQTVFIDNDTQPAAADEPLPTYTIEINHSADLDEAQRHLDDISHIIPIPVRLEKRERDYIIYAGISEKSSDLIPYLETIKKNGYPQAFLRTGRYLKERIILEITGKEGGQANLLELIQKEQPGTGKVRLGEIEEHITKEKEKPSEVELGYKGGYYIGKGWQCFNANDYKQAMEFFAFAQSFPETELEARFGIASCYIKQSEQGKAIPLFEELVGKEFRLDVTLPNLIALLVAKEDYTRARASMDRFEGPEKGKLQKKIEQGLFRQMVLLAKKSDDINQMVSLTRAYQNELKGCAMPEVFYDIAEILAKHGRKEEAIDIYRNLLSTCPDEWDIRLGVFYNLKSLLAPSEMKALVKGEIDRPSPPSSYKQKLTELRENLLKDKMATVTPASPMVKELAKEILAIKPEDADALVTLAWWEYNNELYEAAYQRFSRLYEQYPQNKDYALGVIYTLLKLGKPDEALNIATRFDPTNDPKIAELMLSLYEKTGNTEAASSLVKSLSQTDDKKMQKVAGDFFFRQRSPIMAAQVYSDPGTSYYHADSPSLRVSPYFWSKSGDDGISRLDEFVFPFSASFPFQWGSEAKFSLITKDLLAGDAPQKPFVGNFFRGVQQHGLITSLSVVVPLFEFKKEGNTSYTFELGSTPLNGIIDPLPTFLAQIARRQWRLDVHQKAVEESILSYVGLQDPYSDAKWGRVVKSGGEVEYTFTLSPAYWLSLKGGYDYYWGENVFGNHAFHSAIAFGKTFSKDKWDISPSLFLSGNHFQRDTSYYTFGHGGYFSPDLFYITGPAIRFQTKPGQTFWVDGQVSAGFMHYHLDGSPHFPFESNQNGQYKEVFSSSLGYSMQLEGQKLLTSHWSAGGFLKLNNSANYTDRTVGLSFCYFLEPRSHFVFGR